MKTSKEAEYHGRLEGSVNTLRVCRRSKRGKKSFRKCTRRHASHERHSVRREQEDSFFFDAARDPQS